MMMTIVIALIAIKGKEWEVAEGESLLHLWHKSTLLKTL